MTTGEMPSGKVPVGGGTLDAPLVADPGFFCAGFVGLIDFGLGARAVAAAGFPALAGVGLALFAAGFLVSSGVETAIGSGQTHFASAAILSGSIVG
jgi:hypothetical protein